MKIKTPFFAFPRLAALLLGGLCWLTGSASAQVSKSVAQVEALEKQRVEAQLKKDTLALATIFADDLEFVHSTATKENKAAYLVSLATGKWDYRAMEVQESTAREYDKTVVVTGLVKMTTFGGGRLNNFRMRYTDVYVNRKGKWQMVAYESTRIPE